MQYVWNMFIDLLGFGNGCAIVVECVGNLCGTCVHVNIKHYGMRGICVEMLWSLCGICMEKSWL